MKYRLDHIAWRTLDRAKAVKFFCDALGYREATNFEIVFDAEKKDTAICSVLEPSDRCGQMLPWFQLMPIDQTIENQTYYLDHEIFVSEGSPGSIVHNWATAHGGGNIHHIALQVPDDSTVEKEMNFWMEKGWCEGFTSEAPFVCDDMSQVFTKPSAILGTIFELIKRKEVGFCKDSVRELMNSTKDFT